MHELDISYKNVSDLINTAGRYRTRASVLGKKLGAIDITYMLFFSTISFDTFWILFLSPLLFFFFFPLSLCSPTPSYGLSTALESGLRERSSEDCLICCLRHRVKGSKQVHLVETDTHTHCCSTKPTSTHTHTHAQTPCWMPASWYQFAAK